MKKERLYLGADHAGFKIKEKVKKYLSNYFEIIDVSPKLIEGDDYPDYANTLSKLVVKNKAFGILVCGTGIGMCITANKIKGVRAANIYDKFTAKMAKEHNHANIICLRGRKISFFKIKRLLNIFLGTVRDNEDRIVRRIEKISAIEKQN